MFLESMPSNPGELRINSSHQPVKQEKNGGKGEKKTDYLFDCSSECCCCCCMFSLRHVTVFPILKKIGPGNPSSTSHVRPLTRNALHCTCEEIFFFFFFFTHERAVLGYLPRNDL
jgi:hypothetical protein